MTDDSMATEHTVEVPLIPALSDLTIGHVTQRLQAALADRVPGGVTRAAAAAGGGIGRGIGEAIQGASQEGSGR